MKRKNNKGFTLIELLAVIVILAIIGGFAAQSVIKIREKAVAKSFVIEYQELVKQVQTNAADANKDSDVTCGIGDCSEKYNFTKADVDMIVNANTSIPGTYIVIVASTANGKFSNVKMNKYYPSTDGNSTCNTDAIGSGASSCIYNGKVWTITGIAQ